MSKNIILYVNKNQCSGCGACEQLCPNSAIKMTEDKEGFLYPFIDDKKCVECKKCEQVCPIKNNPEKSDSVKLCYVAYDTNYNNRISSSSGGIFALLSESIIEKEGVVCGVAFDSNWNAHHICIDTIRQVDKIKRSKYVQSRTEKTFKEVKGYLEEGKIVLYSGVECQISGLKKYLDKGYENLFTVGVLCHGVPSPKVWQEYLKWQSKEHQERIKSISFRDKENGWKKYNMNIEFPSGEKYSNASFNDDFMKLFLNDICLRPSCHNCKFKKLDREADITLGDCWGIESYMPEMDDDKGTSVVLIHSEKGKRLFNQIKDSLKYKEAEVDKALPESADSRQSVKPHINRKKMFRRLKRNKQFIELVDCLNLSFYEKVKRKIISIINE